MSQDLGLSRVLTNPGRFINEDGRPNVRRLNDGKLTGLSIYQYLITCCKFRLVGLILSLYSLLNVIFGTVYFSLGADAFKGLNTDTELQHFLYCIFFSTQTITTVGYGGIHPVSIASNLVAAIESFTGLLIFAVITGLIFARFSKAKLELLYSEFALLAPYKSDQTAFLFRFINKRKNELFDMTAQVTLTWVDKSKATHERRYKRLSLEIEKVAMFFANWTVCHPIDENSPFYGWTVEDYQKNDIEVIINISGYDDLFGQTVRSNKSYKWDELKHGAKFKPLYWMGEDGVIEMDITKINDLT